MTLLTISHSAADGTTVDGDPRPHHGILKGFGFRYSRNIPGWYIPRSRDRDPDRRLIGQVATELRAVGFDVNVSIDTTERTRAEIEADNAERSAARAEGLDAKADRLGDRADEAAAKARAISDMIPLGQPVLMGHHSQRRHQKDLARIESGARKSVELGREADEAARRADAARARQAHRESAPATTRRIKRMEADVRGIDRKLTPCMNTGRAMDPESNGRQVTCPACHRYFTVTDGKVPPHGDDSALHPAWEAQLLSRKATLEADIEYWRGHLASLTETGVKMWGPDDFAVGDRVNGSCTVVRVNKKTLTVHHDVFPEGFTNPLAYDKVRSHERPATIGT